METKIKGFTLVFLGSLIVVGCQETVEQPKFTQVTVSIYDSPSYNYDSVFVLITQTSDTLWLDQVYPSEGYYRAVIHLNPGSGYNAQGWAYIQGLRCFNTSYASIFSLATGENKLLALNLNPQLPAAPDTLYHTYLSSNRIDIAWQHNGVLVTGFEIERGRGSADSLHVVATAPAQLRSYQNTGLLQNTMYYFRVRAFNPAGAPHGYSSYSPLDSARTNW